MDIISMEPNLTLLHVLLILQALSTLPASRSLTPVLIK
jgi:hypothetical protein